MFIFSPRRRANLIRAWQIRLLNEIPSLGTNGFVIKEPPRKGAIQSELANAI